MLVYLTFLALVGAMLFEHYLRLKRHDWLRQFPGPSVTLPIVGNAFQFLGHPASKTRHKKVFLHIIYLCTINTIVESQQSLQNTG